MLIAINNFAPKATGSDKIIKPYPNQYPAGSFMPQSHYAVPLFQGNHILP